MESISQKISENEVLPLMVNTLMVISILRLDNQSSVLTKY